MDDGVKDRPRELLIAGHVNVDRLLGIRAFPAADRTVPVVENQIALGGPAANLALVASRFGVRTGLVALIGDDFPAEFRARLEAGQIDTRGLQRVAGRSTPTCYILLNGRGGQRTLIDQGPMGDGSAPRLPAGILPDYSWLHVTTGPPDRHLALVRQARAAKVRIVADPAQEIHYRWDRRRLRMLLADAEILFGNRSEVAAAARISGARTVERLARELPLIVRTEGAHGATAFTGSRRIHALPRPVRRVRRIVGAGDAFRGGFYAGWFAGEPLEACLAAGIRSSSRWVEGTAG